MRVEPVFSLSADVRGYTTSDCSRISRTKSEPERVAVVNTPVIDFHTHVGRWGLNHMDATPERFLRIMDAAGIDKACVNCIFYGEARRSNDTVARYVQANSDRFVPVAYVTPRYPKEAISELERSFDEIGAKFLKLYPTYLGKPIDDPSYMPIFEWGNDRGIVLMSHSSRVSEDDVLTMPHSFVPLAKRFPNITWVLAHSGNNMQGQEESVAAAKECPNIYLETCSSYSEHGAMEFLVEGAGEDRVLYGSDMLLIEPRHQIAKITTADLSDEAKRKILGLNAIRILGLDQ